MRSRDDQRRRRHRLTPIGDEVEFRSRPLEIGRPSLIDRVARVGQRLLRPRNRVLRLALALLLFGITVAAVAGVAYGLGLLVESHSNLTHDSALLTVFLVLGAAVVAPPFFGAVSARTYGFRRAAAPSVDDEAAYDLPKYGMWQRHWTLWIALGVSLLAIGFGVWGRGTQEPDYYLANLEGAVAADWGRHSATCKREQGLLSLCTVKGIDKSDRFQVCVTWQAEPRPLLVYSPLTRCGVDAAGITKPPLRFQRYRASATAACLLRQPDVEVLLFEPFRESERDDTGGIELRVAFYPPRGVRSLAYAFFGKGGRRNVVVEWGNPLPTFVSRFNACLKP